MFLAAYDFLFTFSSNHGSIYSVVFGRPFVCKTVRPMLSDRCLTCPVSLWRWCSVAKWFDGSRRNLAGRPRPWPHCVRWRSSPSPQRGTAPQLSAHICCGQMAG